MKQQMQLILIAVLSILITSSAQKNEALHTDPQQLLWTGKAAFNAYSLTGTIDIKQVRSIVTPEAIEELLIEIDMTSINHENSDLESHLRSKDFFEVSKYKTASFKLSQPAEIVNNQAVLTGMLSIKNTTQETEFLVTIQEDQLIIDIRINRINYGITFNSPTIFEKMKDQAIADEFQLKGKIPLN